MHIRVITFVLFRDSKPEDRASMLRAAFAAQRLEQNNSFQSETPTQSFDSGMEHIMNEDEENETEEFLLELGFGGPPQGAERVPDRFLRPSQMYGIDFEKYIITLKELEQSNDAVWSYRGLTSKLINLEKLTCLPCKNRSDSADLGCSWTLVPLW